MFRQITLNYFVGGWQIVVWRYLNSSDGPDVLITKNALVWVILVQYVPRFLRIFPVTTDLKRTAGVFIETAWAGAAYYLLWFMLAGHVSVSPCNYNMIFPQFLSHHKPAAVTGLIFSITL